MGDWNMGDPMLSADPVADGWAGDGEPEEPEVPETCANCRFFQWLTNVSEQANKWYPGICLWETVFSDSNKATRFKATRCNANDWCEEWEEA